MTIRLMSRPEIAEYLSVSDARVRQLDADGQLPPPVAELRVGRIWLAEDIEEWARARVDRRKKVDPDASE
jgi:predicted DNA-binding transcriptional regulator AlpA